MVKKNYLSIEEVAERFGVNSTTVYRLAQQGSLPAFKIGAQWRFSEAMLDSWVATRITGKCFGAEDEPKKGKKCRQP